MFFSIQPIDWITVGFVLTFLLPIVFLDLKQLTVPDFLVFPGIAVIFLYYVLTDVNKLLPALVHGAVGFTIILLLWLFCRKQIGFGDTKLSFFLAAGLGFWEWWGVLLAGALAAMVYGLIQIKKGRLTMKSKLPLAPFFGIGVVAVVILKAVLSALQILPIQ